MRDRANSSFDVVLQDLMSSLAETVGLLREHGEEQWSAWLERCLIWLRHDDSNALDHLVRAYGGMGSFNDFVLSPTQRPNVPDDVRTANDRLESLRSQCYALAQQLRRELRRS